MAEDTKTRSAFIDNFKGLLIILVVFAHSLYDVTDSYVITSIVKTIYFFHMPAFIFITGYLSKSDNSRSKNSLISLLSMYLIFNTLIILLVNDPNGYQISSPMYSYWYLIAMIIWRIIAERLSKVKGILIITTAIAMIIGFYKDVTNVFAFGRIICFLPFFMCGYMLDKNKFEGFYKNKTASKYIKGVLLLLVSILIIILYINAYPVTNDELTMSPYENVMQTVNRGAIFLFSAFIIIALIYVIPDKSLMFINNAGKFSLGIFLLHRYPTLLFSKYVQGKTNDVVIVLSLLITVAFVLLTGNKYADMIIRKISTIISNILIGNLHNEKNKFEKLTKVVAAILCFILFFSPMIFQISGELLSVNKINQTTASEIVTEDKIYNRITPQQQKEFDNSFKILFTGDLILLEDQVKIARCEDGTYNFDDVFEYTKDYISQADYAIGVFEGPTAGSEAGYSTSNFDDGKTLALNFPDEFAYAVKESGFDLVTTANNHMLDKGLLGSQRTIDVLNKVGLDYTGTYISNLDKQNNRIKIIDSDGIRMAVLSYTYGSNGYSDYDFIDGGQFSFITSILVSPESEYYEAVKTQVREDFKDAKLYDPDIIIVLPHMGEQFRDNPDEFQQVWTGTFFDEGADIVFSDHPHSVQPVEFNDSKLLVNCPGNFVNIYREKNGDCSYIVEAYIDRSTKKPIGAGIVPMWIQSSSSSNYRALPIWSIINDSNLGKQISTDDLNRVKEVWSHVTSVAIGEEIPFSMVSKRCYISEEGYLAGAVEPLKITDQIGESILYKEMISSEKVCFVGDSVTHGTKNGGYGWYEPICTYLKSYTVCAQGGATTKTILNKVNTDSDLYVVAIGTNDVRYRDESICAMTAQDYINEISGFVKRIRITNKDADFAFVAPWIALESDPYSACTIPERDILIYEYSVELEKYCKNNNFIYCDTSEDLKSIFSVEVQSKYLLDHIHPNCTSGIELYCKEVLINSEKNQE